MTAIEDANVSVSGIGPLAQTCKQIILTFGFCVWGVPEYGLRFCISPMLLGHVNAMGYEVLTSLHGSEFEF